MHVGNQMVSGTTLQTNMAANSAGGDELVNRSYRDRAADDLAHCDITRNLSRELYMVSSREIVSWFQVVNVEMCDETTKGMCLPFNAISCKMACSFSRNTGTPEHRNTGTSRNTPQKTRNIFQNTKKSAKSLKPIVQVFYKIGFCCVVLV